MRSVGVSMPRGGGAGSGSPTTSSASLVAANSSPVPAAASPRTAKDPNTPVIINERRMLSRTRFGAIQVIGVVAAGKHQPGCCTCCNAPTWARCCELLPCCDKPAYIVKKREASKYIVLRENSLEWNNPSYTTDYGCCFGMSLCGYRLSDRVSVLYYDDLAMERVDFDSGCCCFTGCWNRCCSSEGQRVVMKATCCGGFCLRGLPPCCCIPSAFPLWCCPWALAHELYVEDGREAVAQIMAARDNARARLT